LDTTEFLQNLFGEDNQQENDERASEQDDHDLEETRLTLMEELLLLGLKDKEVSPY
jgi:hypothetical protein